jgi:hypothetical protein
VSILDRLRARQREQWHVAPVSFPELPLGYPADVLRVPVLVVSYFPATDGHISRRVTGDVDAPLDVVRAHTEKSTRRIVDTLDLGSIYHGYKDPLATPSLQYEVVEKVEFLERLPTWRKPHHDVPMTDYRAIVERVGIGPWVEERGIKEVWLWGYHGGVVDLWESNMAGPHGDISNSDRDTSDLPVFNRTYTMYHYNYGRGVSEAVEDHMHQIEAVLRHVDPKLFWEQFVGKPGEGRCGWAHFPPNGRRDYDWANTELVATDIEDWTPEGGVTQRLNCHRWGGDSLTWFMYWMQNLPGRGSALTYRGRPLTNWWSFIGDWDRVMAERTGLVK